MPNLRSQARHQRRYRLERRVLAYLARTPAAFAAEIHAAVQPGMTLGRFGRQLALWANRGVLASESVWVQRGKNSLYVMRYSPPPGGGDERARAKPRRCLCCDTDFDSEWAGNRLCPSCRERLPSGLT